MTSPNWLDPIVGGIKRIYYGALLPARSTLEFTGAGVTVTDNSTTKRTVVTVASSGAPTFAAVAAALAAADGNVDIAGYKLTGVGDADDPNDAVNLAQMEAAIAAGGGGGVTSVTGTAPIVSSGGATPAISISAASGAAAGSQSAAHYTQAANATDAATASCVAKRDASGNCSFAALTATTVTASSTVSCAAPSAGGHAVNKTYADANYSGLDAFNVAGAGLTNSGRTVNVVANADGSIVANANDIQVGVLATDAQHGVRGGGTQHAAATGATAGFMSAADKTTFDAATSAATASTIAKRGASSECAFGALTATTCAASTSVTAPFFTTAGTVASAGVLRTANVVTAVAARNAAGSADVSLVACDASNNALFGDSTNAANCKLQAATQVQCIVAGTTRIAATSTGATVTGLLDVTNGITTTTLTASSTITTTGTIHADGNLTVVDLAYFDALITAYGGVAASGSVTASSFARAPYFETASSGMPTAGVLRTANASTAVAARNAAGAGDLAALATTAADHVVLGSATNVAGVDIKTASGSHVMSIGATDYLTISTPGGSVTQLTAAAGGMIVSSPDTFQFNAASEFYMRGTAFEWRTAGGGTRRRMDHGTVQTTNATQTTVVSRTVETDKTVHVRFIATGDQSGGSGAISVEVVGTYKNVGGTLSLVGSLTTVHSQSDGSLTASATIDFASPGGTAVRGRVTGETGKTVDWSGWLEITGRMS